MKQKKIIGEIANKTISEKIYSKSDALKETAARFLIKKYPELFEDWNDKRWTFYYDMVLQKKVSFTKYFYNLDISIINKRFLIIQS